MIGCQSLQDPLGKVPLSNKLLMFLSLFLGSFFGLKAEKLQGVILVVCNREEMSLSLLVPVTYKEMIHFSEPAQPGLQRTKQSIKPGNYWSKYYNEIFPMRSKTLPSLFGMEFSTFLNRIYQLVMYYTSSMARKNFWFKREMKRE